MSQAHVNEPAAAVLLVRDGEGDPGTTGILAPLV